MEEKWVPVVGFEEGYEVSNYGGVRSRRFSSRTFPGKVIKPRVNPSTFRYYVGLHRDRKLHCKAVHKLVATAFLGHPPKGMEVNHIDGDKHNNSVTNLEYITRAANMAHAAKNGLSKGPRGENHPRSKFTASDIVHIRNSPLGRNELARQFSVSPYAIYAVRKRLVWGYID